MSEPMELGAILALQKDFEDSAEWTAAALWNQNRLLMDLPPFPEKEAAAAWWAARKESHD